jgi:hypothetical protein
MGRGVHHGGGDAGDEIGRAGAAGRNGNADPAAGTGISVSHVRGTLFVARQHVVNLRVFAEGIIGDHDVPARIPKYQCLRLLVIRHSQIISAPLSFMNKSPCCCIDGQENPVWC